MTPRPPLFSSFTMGGFECSTHRRSSGRRLDLIDATGHDRFAAQDYRRMAAARLGTARDGLRWHLIERVPGQYGFHSAHPQLAAAAEAGVQVIWDLLHYGWPDHVDVFAANFPETFARYACAAARFLRTGTSGPLWLCPINEISFLAWGGGEVGYFNPHALGRGDDLKRQLVRAAVLATRAVREADPQACFLHVDPLIHVTGDDHTAHAAQAEHEAQFQSLDMLLGRLAPELGGAFDLVDVIGLNYYPYNQWRLTGPQRRRETLEPADLGYRPLRSLLASAHARYNLPLLIAETGTEDQARPDWLRRVGAELQAAQAAGVPLEGVCLYPVLNHPGWDDDRHCHNGLWDYPDQAGERPVYAPLAAELSRLQAHLARRSELVGAVAQAASGTRQRAAWGAAVTPPGLDSSVLMSWRPGSVLPDSVLPGSPLPDSPLLDSALSEPLPPPSPLRLVLGRFSQAAPVIAAEAAARDADAEFPAQSFQALRQAGVLSATLPLGEGGLGLEGAPLLAFLRRVGRSSLPIGRVYEGHVNALHLIGRLGTPAQIAQARQDARRGELFGVWNTEQSPGLRVERLADGALVLRGGKTFASGAGHVTRPLMGAEWEAGSAPEAQAGRLLVLLPRERGPGEIDRSFWQPLGMRPSASHRIDFGGQPVMPGDLIGQPGDYYRQPDFSGGALRFLAVQLGGADALLEAGRELLRGSGRSGDDVQRLRFADMAAQLEAAWQVTCRAQVLLEQQQAGAGDEFAFLTYLSLARSVTQDACLLTCEGSERAVGARGLIAPEPTERLLRDLRMYLRQPAPDAARLGLGRSLRASAARR
ncbi:acyl-CoA dehydrogenase family protein [Deinococcus sp.]|uniref:acyl-CoA dehydrogenase family protein n=1 Tax=Deinococcus sp. TaxID=47478 RepID=UPI0025DE4443|nr:acyl-CoA dehydrogenase family protein [Deinococcus sp.]